MNYIPRYRHTYVPQDPAVPTLEHVSLRSPHGLPAVVPALTPYNRAARAVRILMVAGGTLLAAALLVGTAHAVGDMIGSVALTDWRGSS